MTKNPIQEKRMKEYFLQSACEIIRAEGIRALNVRTVAERAGYSFATLYNYYSDFKELVYHCVVYFLGECEQFIKDSAARSKSDATASRKIAQAYINYFIQYPGTFELVFMERMSELNNDRIGELINNFMNNTWNEEIMGTRSNKSLEVRELFNLLNGTLLMYFFRRTPGSYKEFVQKAEKVLELFS